MMLKMAPVRETFYEMAGGLDLLTPALDISPGKCIDATNYEPEISGGYRRIDGYERYDGRASPSSKQYWAISANITGSVTTTATLTGATSGATGIVLGVFNTNVIVLARVTGTFVIGEALQISALTVATATSGATPGGATTPSDDADWALLAANDWRQFIGIVPGSGQVRGVWVYKDVVYAFRDNAGGTAGLMYKATASGWQQIVFGYEITFSGAVGQVNVGDTITGGTSGATAVVVAALLRTGSWTSAGVGSLVLGIPTGTFVNGEAIKVATVTKVTASSGSAQIARSPGGRLEFDNINFTGSTSTQKMYGADGINLCFEFDGTNYVPIRTGMAVDTPLHVKGHKNYLWLSYLGSAQYSGIGNPYAWTVILGSGEIATGDTITGFLPQSGTSAGASMAIFTRSKLFILYGSSDKDWNLVPSNSDLGYAGYTCQQVSNNSYGLTARGIQSLITTLTYGDFDYASISHLIQPFMVAKLGLETASTSIRSKNQYRVYFNDGTAIVVGLTGDKVNGLMPLNYGKPVRCMVTTTLSTGTEVTYFGSDDGYVYQDNIGTSFDGGAIEAWCRLAYNHVKTPRERKRWRRAVLEVQAVSFSKVNVSYDLGYGTFNATPPAMLADTQLVGGGGFWDQVTWDQFTWDTQVIADPSLTLNGTEKNIGFLFYSSRAQDRSHTIQGITLIYSVGRTER